MTIALELLAPAKNAEIGVEAIRHGADAVYIGGPAYGARASAGNDLAGIERLAAFAHRFRARVFVALNTLLRDAELEAARTMAWRLYDAGADALIVQDMGLLEADLPPLQLHASTQTDIRTLAKAQFLQDVGFSQLVLARELSLEQIAAIHAGLKVGAGGTAASRTAANMGTAAALEFFVHGALCVSYSGQCYISHAHTGRSANRGECSQACRLPYTLEDADGRVVARDRHLLSMKDNDQSANLAALIAAGIRSFKIEGRLKDLAYVKNITAHYRTLLDAFLEDHPGHARASSGRCTFAFKPRPEKTFNRGSTDYFVRGRGAEVGAFDTPKFSGEAVGRVTRIGDDWLEIDGRTDLHNGDGLSFFDAHHELVGLRVNRVDGRRLFPAAMPEGLAAGMTLHRNRDQAFERLLEKASAERRIAVDLRLRRDDGGLALEAADEDGIRAEARLADDGQPASDPARASRTLRDALAKLGSTDFAAGDIRIDLDPLPFLPAARINGLRRAAIGALVAAREAVRPRLPRAAAVEPPVSFPESDLTYLGNVLNAQARAFYARHGVRVIEDAYETGTVRGEVSLMITRHCLRYSFDLCPKEWKQKTGDAAGLKAEPMALVHNGERLTLRFDCKACEMHVVGRLKKHRRVPLVPLAPA